MDTPNKTIGLSSDLNQELPATSLLIEGSLPSWLNGVLLRNGPAKFTAGNQRVAHWFDGLAMLHSFAFAAGKVTYANRFLRTPAYHQVFDKKSLDYLGFACDPCRTIFRRLMTAFFPDKHCMPNADVNIAKYAEHYVALTEIPLPVRFDPATLATLGVLDFKDALPVSNCFESAHPHRDNQKEETINYIVNFGMSTSYEFYKQSDQEAVRHTIGKLPVSRPSYMHTFSITEKYIVITEYPFKVKPLDFLLKGKPFIENYHWEEGTPTSFQILDRKSGKLIKTMETDPFFSFHHINAFELNGLIYLDLLGYPDSRIVGALANYGCGKPAPDFPQPRLMRFKVDIKAGSITHETYEEISFELPRFNSTLCEGRPYRYAYGVDLNEPLLPLEARGLYKLDLDTMRLKSWQEEGCFPGEGVFIPNPNGSSEDDGVVASIVLDDQRHCSFLLLLDAQHFTEIARAFVPHAIPMGLHGQYFAE